MSRESYTNQSNWGFEWSPDGERHCQLEPNSSFHFSSSSHLLFCKLGLITVMAFLKSSYLKGRNYKTGYINGVSLLFMLTLPFFYWTISKTTLSVETWLEVCFNCYVTMNKPKKKYTYVQIVLKMYLICFNSKNILWTKFPYWHHCSFLTQGSQVTSRIS